MTNKKRLGEIKEYFSFWMRNDLTRDWGLSQESVDNLKYLIQHAERAESLLKQTGHNFEVNRKLDAENQRYKQALEELRKYVNSDDFYDNSWDVKVINKFLDKALASEPNG